MNPLTAAATFYKEGGLFMHFVLVIAMLINAILVERLIVLARATKQDPRKLADELVRMLARGDLAGARHVVMNSTTPVGRVAEAMLNAAPGDAESIQTAADDTATLIMPDLNKRLAYLGMLANSATLIGLLGTITGLITAISGVGMADAAQRSASLAAGISEALHTTAFGLIVAIPTLLVQGWMSGRVDGIAEGIDHVAIRVSKALQARPMAAHANAHAAAAHAQPVALPRTAPAAGHHPMPHTRGRSRRVQ